MKIYFYTSRFSFIHQYLFLPGFMKTELIVIQLNLLCLSLFTVLLLYVASVLGCFVVRDFCRGGFRQNFANFYLTPPPPPSIPP